MILSLLTIQMNSVQFHQQPIKKGQVEKNMGSSGQVWYLGIFLTGKTFGMLSSRENVTGNTNKNHESDPFCCFMICKNLSVFLYVYAY